MKRLLTVRIGYVYIFMGSTLLSGISLFVVYRVFVLAYSHFSSDSFFIRLSHGLINHIGKTPIAVFIFLSIFTGVFMLRSQKPADDIQSLLRAAEELAEKGSFEKLEVASGGELGALAAHLRRINHPERSLSTGSLTAPRVENKSTTAAAQLGNDEIMALILRIKSLLRTLDDIEDDGNHPDRTAPSKAEAVKREALGMERFLESLITAS
ncbi:hypothetical protein GRF59_24105 [Paenibacillus sp. HJL G12]|uniref:Uncharacterized protein n=1 Tax=Paenibacillus dendrobii TaxID=2691084 RepID=A0A7X3IMH7_9BACL|nr:hypothetical protein [Paenibacillus dendrobii]MWV46698.1 hypothetical protein [Paenibacillus dendrobii]